MNKKLSTIAWTTTTLGLLCACDDVPAPYFILEEEVNDPSVTGIYLNETFSTSFGSFATYQEATDGYNWTIDYSTAKISGYDNSAATNKATKAWLISSPIDLSESTGAYVTFDYILRYKRTTTQELVRVSTDYDGDPLMATWITLDITMTEGADWETFYTAACNLPDSVIGKDNVVIALYYEAGASEASTWEVKNLTVREGEATAEPEPEPEAGVYVSEAFSSSFGSFTAKAELTDGANWAINYSTAAISGFDNTTQTKKASKAWLLSSPIDFSTSEGAYVAFEYVLRYKGTTTKEIVRVSTDYTDDPTTATWTDLDITLTEGSDWSTFYTAQCNLPAAVIGKAGVTLAFYYEADENNASTWEVRNLVVKEGEASETPVTPTGDSSRDNPYTVAQAKTGSGKAWVKGYIVGYVSGMNISTSTFAPYEDASALETDLLLADNANETDYGNCLPVQLPAGVIRESLQPSAANYKKEVILYGSLESYFSTGGLKSTSFAIIDGKTVGTDPTDNTGGGTTTGDAIFSNSLLGDEAGFTIRNVTIPSGLNYVWINSSSFGWKASAFYNSTSYATESWLISPAIALPSEDCNLTFDHAINYGSTNAMSVHISTDATHWTAVTVPSWPINDGKWVYVSSGKIDLSTYKGQTIYIGFKYTSTSDEAATWEIKNFAVTKGAGESGSGSTSGGGDEGGSSSGTITGAGTYLAPYTAADVIALYAADNNISQQAYVKGYAVGYVNTGNYNNGVTFEIPATDKTSIIIADSPSETTPDKCIPVQLLVGDFHTGLDLYTNPSLFQKEVLVYGTIARIFFVGGVKSLSYAEADGKTIGTKPE